MKTLQDYIEEYGNAIKDAKPGQQVVSRPIYILAAWETDNRTGPWLPDYEEKLQAVGKTDPDLLKELLTGFDLFSKIVKGELKQEIRKDLYNK